MRKNDKRNGEEENRNFLNEKYSLLLYRKNPLKIII